MKEQLRNALLQWGADVDGAVRRFAGNEALYEKFLYKFLQDETFGSLKEAAARGDMEEALRASHTLKGLTGNLGLNPVFTLCSDYVAAIRAGKLSKLPGLYEEINNSYQAVTRILQENEG